MKQVLWAAFRKGMLFHIICWGLPVLMIIIPGSYGREHDIHVALETLLYSGGFSVAMFAVHVFAVLTERPVNASRQE